MSRRFEILVEELSMEIFLRDFLPRVLPDEFEIDVNCFIYPHEGKSDLRKRLPHRLRAYRHYPEKVIILVIQDQDSSDCKVLKQSLVNLMEEARGDIKYLVRIACKELENWYLGDLKAVEQIYPKSKAGTQTNKAKFRNPDRLNGAEEMEKFSKEFAKVSCAREIAPIINIQSNKSVSFRHLVKGVLHLLEA